MSARKAFNLTQTREQVLMILPNEGHIQAILIASEHRRRFNPDKQLGENNQVVYGTLKSLVSAGLVGKEKIDVKSYYALTQMGKNIQAAIKADDALKKQPRIQP